MKRVDELTVTDFTMHAVWEFVDDVPNVIPVAELPVNSLQNRVVGTQVRLANGQNVWAALSNVSLSNPRRTSQFLTLSIENGEAWFHLSRYFDVDFQERGPSQLADFLGLPVSEVFPIRYDLSDAVSADTTILKGSISPEPQERLSQEELIELALETD